MRACASECASTKIFAAALAARLTAGLPARGTAFHADSMRPGMISSSAAASTAA